MKVEIKPFIMQASDYHYFYSFQRNLAQAGVKVEVEEIGCGWSSYHAVIWVSGDEEAAFAFMMTDKNCLEFANEEID